MGSLPVGTGVLRSLSKMSDDESTPIEVDVEETGGTMDIMTALKEVLKKALIQDGLARGLHEAAKTLEKGQAHLCVLAADCSEAAYVKLVEALCLEHDVNLIKVPTAKELGEWVGLCKYDREGQARKVVGCSCAVVRDFGVKTEALDVLLEYFKSNK